MNRRAKKTHHDIEMLLVESKVEHAIRTIKNNH